MSVIAVAESIGQVSGSVAQRDGQLNYHLGLLLQRLIAGPSLKSSCLEGPPALLCTLPD